MITEPAIRYLDHQDATEAANDQYTIAEHHGWSCEKLRSSLYERSRGFPRPAVSR